MDKDKIHKILDATYRKFEASKSTAVIRYLLHDRDAPPSSGQPNIRLYPIKKLDDIGDGVFIRGKFDDSKITEYLHGGESAGSESFRAAILLYNKDEIQNSFMIAPIVPTEGCRLTDRIKMAKHMVLFLVALGMTKIKICMLTGTRKRWKLNETTAKFSREAQAIRHSMTGDTKFKEEAAGAELIYLPESLHDRNEVDFEIEEAIKRCDIIIPFNGSTGNVIVRCLHFFSENNNFKLLSVPWFKNYSELLPVGEGGFMKDYELKAHVRAAVTWYFIRNGGSGINGFIRGLSANGNSEEI